MLMKKKIVKKCLALSIIGAMTMGLLACGNSSSDNSGSSQQTADSTQQENDAGSTGEEDAGEASAAAEDVSI